MKSISKRVYYKKIAKLNKHSVWLVNGELIRRDIEEDFVNFDQYFHLNFIPKDEFWIDKESPKHEWHYFIDHLRIENRLMSRGISYSKALKIADKLEERERKKSILVRRIRKKHLQKQEIVNKIHKRLLAKYSKKVKIWLVNGELVRDIFLLEYAEGGHDKVYHFIPKDEIWIESNLSEKERKFIILHELHERYLMSKGWKYKKAHRSATKAEDHCRHKPKDIKKYIEKEVSKNMKI